MQRLSPTRNTYAMEGTENFWKARPARGYPHRAPENDEFANQACQDRSQRGVAFRGLDPCLSHKVLKILCASAYCSCVALYPTSNACLPLLLLSANRWGIADAISLLLVLKCVTFFSPCILSHMTLHSDIRVMQQRQHRTLRDYKNI